MLWRLAPFSDGYLAALRQSQVIEPLYLIHRLEEEATRFLYDPFNFEAPLPQTEAESDYYNVIKQNLKL